MARPPISATIISFNEEANIERAIQSVSWADEVLVVDSGSSDRTQEIARTLGAKVLVHAWPGYGKQKNYAQDHAKHDWVLNIDADEAVTPELAAEIRGALDEVGSGTSNAHGFYFPRKTQYLGRWILHGGWYPNHLIRLADRRAAKWSEPSVHEQLMVEGEVRGLSKDLHHFTFGNIQDQVQTNLRLSWLGYEELRKRGARASLLKLLLKPVGKFLETYVMKRGFLDGLPGFIISVNAAHSMFLKYSYLIEAKLSKIEDSKLAKNAHPDRR